MCIYIVYIYIYIYISFITDILREKHREFIEKQLYKTLDTFFRIYLK